MTPAPMTTAAAGISAPLRNDAGFTAALAGAPRPSTLTAVAARIATGSGVGSGVFVGTRVGVGVGPIVGVVVMVAVGALVGDTVIVGVGVRVGWPRSKMRSRPTAVAFSISNSPTPASAANLTCASSCGLTAK